MIARSVVVLPTPLRPSSAVTPPSGTLERDALEHVRARQMDMEVVDREEGRRQRQGRSQRLTEVGRLDRLVVHHVSGRVAREQRAVVHHCDALGDVR